MIEHTPIAFYAAIHAAIEPQRHAAEVRHVVGLPSDGARASYLKGHFNEHQLRRDVWAHLKRAKAEPAQEGLFA